MDYPLLKRLSDGTTENSDLLDRFLDYVAEINLKLYPAQEEAILALFDENNVILNTPTGSGKSLVALALHFKSLAQKKRSVYTCPIKALVNEKFLSLCRDFGPDQVGMMTGDASVNKDAPILCCTAEILSNMALHEGANIAVSDVIMDEFHYYSDKQRGVAWQIPLLTLSKTRFLLMSATLGDMTFFKDTLTSLNSRPTVVVESNERPVPLDFKYCDTPLHETIKNLIDSGRSPIYLVNFTQREAAEEAQNLLSVDFLTKDEKSLIAREIEETKFSSPYGKEFQRLIKHGIGLHHGGLLPKYRIVVERLAQKGFLKVISGTDTLGVGVNIPIRTVLFTKLCKYDGEKTGILSVRDFKQISGRAGRKGFDDSGTVVVQAPEHVIENLKLTRKAEGDPKKLRKLVKRQPPEKGYVHWDQTTFTRLTTNKPEALVSRFQVTHGMLLEVLSRSDGNGCMAMRKLIRDCHETPESKRALRKISFQLFRSLIDRKIIEFVLDERSRYPRLQVNLDLQEDFSLNHSLSLYLIDTIKKLDPQSETHSLDLLTLVESILEDPDLILRKQLDRIKTEKMSEMKMAGIEYDERIAELEKLEYPKPNRDFIYDTFNEFASKHPWVGHENIRPKSVAREMYETFQSFSDYVREYDLQRTEGLLLRYLSEVYKVLVQTVPETARSDEVNEIIVYFGSMIRDIDSSLLDEWEKLRDPTFVTKRDLEKKVDPSLAPDITQNKRAFIVLIRNEIFKFLKALSIRDYPRALSIVETEGMSPEGIEKLMEIFYTDHQRICTDPSARASHNTHFDQANDQAGFWTVEQVIVDPDGFNDWFIEFNIDLNQARQTSKVTLKLKTIRGI